MGTIQDDFHKHGTVCVSTDCWKRWWTMEANSLKHLPLILSGPGTFFGLIFASYFLTSSTCSVIGCMSREWIHVLWHVTICHLSTFSKFHWEIFISTGFLVLFASLCHFNFAFVTYAIHNICQ